MNYEPLIDSIARMIGAGKNVATEGAGKLGETQHNTSDVEKWLGTLSKPEQQVPLIHDYLRGGQALQEAEATNATHVRDISVPVWQSAQKMLQQRVDADPEVGNALRTMYVNRNLPRDPDVVTEQAPSVPAGPRQQSVEEPADAPTTLTPKPRLPRPVLDQVAARQRAQAWNEFAIATEAQDGPRIDAALERVRGLHDADQPTQQGSPPDWQRALGYMANLEQKVAEMRQTGVTNEAWSDELQKFRDQAGIGQVALPRPIRTTLERFEAWADAQKPATMEDRFAQALGVPRAVMSSADFSAPGRQGLLMLARPEYWANFRPMFEAWDESKFLESQAYIRNHPDIEAAKTGGLALTDMHAKLAPREEAFQSQMAERIPVLGPVVKGSEQAYVTFLNRLRLDVFSNSLRQAAAAGIDVKDPEFLKSLSEWINTSTGRGGRGFDPGVLSTVLFSPRLAIARFQTFNPWYYYKMHPFVRAQAIKTNLAAAGLVFGLVSLAGMAGAKVTWDFRSPDAGKIRVGNTRLDLGGGHYQFLRLFTQLASGQRVNPEGKVTELGKKFGAPTRLDLVTNFIISKEAPVASFVTDWLRGKDQAGNKFNLTNELLSRTVPLAMQDTYDVLKDKGVEGLIYAMPAIFGVGLQTYAPRAPHETIPFIGVTGEVPPEKAAEFAKVIEGADSIAATKAAEKTKNLDAITKKRVLSEFVQAERLRARIDWIKANREAFVKARLAGQQSVPLVAPEGQQ